MAASEQPESLSFGKRIATARKKLGLSLKELALKIEKEDGQPISPQYLNDIEHDRRQPDSPHLIEQFASALQIQRELLYFEAGKLSADALRSGVDEKTIVAAYQAFRKIIRDK
ncbi:MAG TPA: helix-turn-helix transcriptional regulator [Verrucomicrobiales bacterium]|nr:helix-turn-helix transcriptional regulator [Verrucomicrobiales bacterium]